MQTEEQRQKLDEVSGLVNQFCDLANRFGQKFKVASPSLEVDGGSFQVARYKGTWELVWAEESEVQQDLRASSMAVKRKFLTIAGEFFRRYVGAAQAWEKTIDTDIQRGREALDEIRKLIA